MNTKEKTQRDFIKELTTLATENPDLNIKFCTSSEVLGDDFEWTSQEIYKIEIKNWYENGEGEVFTDEADIKEEISGYTAHFHGLTEEEKENKLSILLKQLVIKKICVFTH